MKKIMIAVMLVLVGGGAYYFLAYPPVVKKRAAERSLAAFSEAVATKDRTQIGAALTKFLAPDAKIRLEISFISIQTVLGRESPPLVQDFTKETFIPFIDNVLYPLTDYMYNGKIESFELSEDGKQAAVGFANDGWADGISHASGIALNMRYTVKGLCSGSAIFSGEEAQLKDAVCQLQLRLVPKPGELDKVKDMGAMREILTGQ
ncbi:MAG: hypothetical protein LW823_09920 [Rickettsiales bacterium]|jgi:hypothetical protein|nr:hypothetical protein [Rickettsiales bacterium]